MSKEGSLKRLKLYEEHGNKAMYEAELKNFNLKHGPLEEKKEKPKKSKY